MELFTSLEDWLPPVSWKALHGVTHESEQSGLHDLPKVLGPLGYVDLRLCDD